MKGGVSIDINAQTATQEQKLLPQQANSSHTTRQLSIMNIQMDSQESNDIKLLKTSKNKNKKPKGSLRYIDTQELLSGEADYQIDHVCSIDELTERCSICGCTVRNPYLCDNIFNNKIINKPFSIYYVDYRRTFARKMECHQLPPQNQKYFLLFNYLPYLRQWSLFVLDRKQQQGLEELIFPNNIKIQGGSPRKEKLRQIEQAATIPFVLKMAYPFVKPIKSQKDKAIRLTKRKVEENQKDNGFEDCNNYQNNHSDSFEKSKYTYDFDSFTVLGNHESSNIGFCTVNQAETKCQILLRSDTNTKGCLHWFMFTVKINSLLSSQEESQISSEELPQLDNLEVTPSIQEDDKQQQFTEEAGGLETKKTISFSILNNQRNGYLFREGMQVAILDSSKPEKGWHRGGESIFYYKSNVDHQFFQQEGSTSSKQFPSSSEISDPMLISQIQPNTKLGFQTMDFSYTFTDVDQRVTFAYCFPYSLTDLVRFLEKEEGKLNRMDEIPSQSSANQNQRKIQIKTDTVLYRRKIIGCSRLGLPIILLKITSANESQNQRKKVIFIIARQHPGETPASFVCQGLIQFLLSDSLEAQFLRDTYIFKIVPMVNPDGVVTGNSRCNLAGADLNRKWSCPDPVLHPEVFEVKKILKSTHQKREVLIFCDLHGHSTKKESFFYGCNKTSWGGASSWTQVRLLPRILAKKCRFFNLAECHFRVTEDKRNTARVVAWRELKIQNSFTLETSFFGYNDTQNEGKPTQFTIADLENIGKCLGESYFEYTLAMDAIGKELAANGGQLKAKIPQDSLSKQRQLQSASKNQKGNISNPDQANFSSKVISLLGSNTAVASMLSSQKQSYQMNNSQMTVSSILVSKMNGSLSPQIRVSTPSRTLANPNKQIDFNKNKIKIAGNVQIKLNSNNLNIKKDNGICQMELITQEMKERDWRDYFGKDELEKNFKRIARGEDPNEQESVSGSDSEAEVDIFKEGELRMLASRGSICKKKVKTKKMKKEKSSTIDLFAKSNQGQIDEKKKILVSSAVGSSQPTGMHPERSKWNPSPFINTFKQQMEMKKQQLTKKSYPIAKVGQNFVEQDVEKGTEIGNNNNITTTMMTTTTTSSQVNSVASTAETSNSGSTAGMVYSQLLNGNGSQQTCQNGQVYKINSRYQQIKSNRTDDICSNNNKNKIFSASPIKRIKLLHQGHSDISSRIVQDNKYCLNQKKILIRDWKVFQQHNISESRERRDGLGEMDGSSTYQQLQDNQFDENGQSMPEGLENIRYQMGQEQEDEVEQDNYESIQDDDYQDEQFQEIGRFSQKIINLQQCSDSMNQLIHKQNDLVQDNSGDRGYCYNIRRQHSFKDQNHSRQLYGGIIDYPERNNKRWKEIDFDGQKSNQEDVDHLENTEQKNQMQEDEGEEGEDNNGLINGSEDDEEYDQQFSDKVKEELESSPWKRLLYYSVDLKNNGGGNQLQNKDMRPTGNLTKTNVNERLFPQISTPTKKNGRYYSEYENTNVINAVQNNKKDNQPINKYILNGNNCNNNIKNFEYQLPYNNGVKDKLNKNQQLLKEREEILKDTRDKNNFSQVKTLDSRDKTQLRTPKGSEKNNGFAMIQDKIGNIIINSQQCPAGFQKVSGGNQYIRSAVVAASNSSFVRVSQEKIVNSVVKNSLAAYKPTLKKIRARSIQEGKHHIHQKIASSQDEYKLQQIIQQGNVMQSAFIQQRYNKAVSHHSDHQGVGASSYLYASPQKKTNLI